MDPTVFQFFPRQELQSCPACARPIAQDNLSFNRQELIVQAARRGRAARIQEYTCCVRVCACGLRMAVMPSYDNMLGYAFQCRLCDAYTTGVDKAGRCIGCLLEKKAGVKDAQALFEILEESQTSMGISRSEFLNGFLKGVILGVPGLVCEDQPPTPEA
ncbi:MAG: hypothetical protein ACYCW6_09580 [Candidatus Xenobia bacterium]